MTTHFATYSYPKKESKKARESKKERKKEEEKKEERKERKRGRKRKEERERKKERKKERKRKKENTFLHPSQAFIPPHLSAFQFLYLFFPLLRPDPSLHLQCLPDLQSSLCRHAFCAKIKNEIIVNKNKMTAVAKN